MISFVYGVSGSGKSTYIESKIKESAAAGRGAFLIVPEQETYIAERRYTGLLPPSSQLSFEVVNFTRLANKAHRLYGGLSYNYIDPAMKALFMWRNLRELAPLLEEYGGAAGSPSQLGALSALMLGARAELSAAALTPAALERGAEELPEGSPLRSRLRDLALISASYDNLVRESYDDAAEELDKFAVQLEEHDFFAGREVYIDSFTSFTAQEYGIIRHIFRQADAVTVALCCDSPSSGLIHFAGVRDTSDRLREMAGLRGGYRDITLGRPLRSASPDLLLLEKYLWRLDVDKIDESEAVRAEKIKLFVCENLYSEAEAAANRIILALRGGLRCRDIAVIMRDARVGAGIVDAVFDKFGIPYFMSERSDLASKPLIKLILSALRIKNRNFRQGDVISHLKTGLCGISEREADIFEDYCSVWNINGAAFTRGIWSMNPDGYTTALTPRGKEILRVANSVREALISPLLTLFTSLDAAADARGMCAAIYEYTERLDVRGSLAAQAARERGAGELRGAGETLRTYDIFIGTLDKAAAALADEDLTCEEFAAALRLVFDASDIGSLPTRQDEVTVGSASLLRVDSPRLVIILGMNEGEFPADVTEGGLFSSADRALLGSLGIRLSGDPALKFAEELFYVYRALTSASGELHISCSSGGLSGGARESSVAYRRIQAIFPTLKAVKYEHTDPLERLQTSRASLEHLKTLGTGPEAEALRASLARCGDVASALDAVSRPLADPDAGISTERAEALFGGDISLSQSRLESYVRCPFAYFCNYVIGLRESAPAEFGGSGIGDFLHYVMEAFMREATRGGSFDPEIDDAGAEALADRIITSYASLIIPEGSERESRLRYLFARLRRITLLLIADIREEFAHSLFVPSFFELSLDGSSPDFPTPAEFVSSDGTRIKLRGTVDRVDLFRRGGDVYIRVVDYKSGSRVYSPGDISEGLGMQLLLYLFSLCRSGSPEFRHSVGCASEGRIYPAGALYLSANLPVISVDDEISEGEIKELAAKKISRSGPLLSDDEILRAMNDNFDPAYLAGAQKDKNGVTKGKFLNDLKGFDRLYDTIGQTIAEISHSLRAGVAKASPRFSRGVSPCDFCPYTGVCRSGVPSGRYK